MGKRTLFTIGHSTRRWDEFVSLLAAWKIAEVIDVRTVPRSRACPWFSTAKLAAALPKRGIRYVHIAALGGFRHPRPDSPNNAWRNTSFRGYADYMASDAFATGLKRLDKRRDKRRVCVMCSESVWWRCHRRMIADVEVARGVPVRHIMSERVATPHKLSDFAVVKKRRGRPPLITYPR
jgi:uncharacterized protein (DUF488 family)